MKNAKIGEIERLELKFSSPSNHAQNLRPEYVSAS